MAEVGKKNVARSSHREEETWDRAMAKSMIFLLVDEAKGEGEDYRKVVNWERRTGRGAERSERNLGVAGGRGWRR